MKYTIEVPVQCYVTVSDVEAESESEAIDLAFEQISVTSFVGNNGIDKLIGVKEGNQAITAGELNFDDVNVLESDY